MIENLRITILDRASAENALRGPHPYTHLISCRNSDAPGPIDGFRSVVRVKAIYADDISRPFAGYQMASDGDIRAIIAFARELRKRHLDEKRSADLLIHCEQGVSRSTASALIVLATLLGPGKEDAAIAEVLRLRPIAQPNSYWVTLADGFLDRGGRLIMAVREAREAALAKYAQGVVLAPDGAPVSSDKT